MENEVQNFKDEIIEMQQHEIERLKIIIKDAINAKFAKRVLMLALAGFLLLSDAKMRVMAKGWVLASLFLMLLILYGRALAIKEREEREVNHIEKY